MDSFQSVSAVSALSEENSDDSFFQKIVDGILDMVNNLLDLTDKLTNLFDAYVKKPIDSLRTDIFTLFDTKVYEPLMSISKFLDKGLLEIMADSLQGLEGLSTLPNSINKITDYVEELRETDGVDLRGPGFSLTYNPDDPPSWYHGAWDVGNHDYWGMFDTFRDGEFDFYYDYSYPSFVYKAEIFAMVTENRLNREMMQVMKDSNVFESKKIQTLLQNILTKLSDLTSGSGGNESNFVFDYERLESLLNNLEFGSIINEEGTNIWDFLSELVKELGETIRTSMTELTNAFDRIIDLLDGLIDTIIGLIIPKNVDFVQSGFDVIKVKFNIKFGAFLGLADSVKDTFTPTPQNFKESVSFEFMGAKFNPDFSLIDSYVQKFRVIMSLSIWLSVVIYVFRKITGQGDLINDN